MDCSPPGSSVHGISQARALEWVAISFFPGRRSQGIFPTQGSPRLYWEADPLPPSHLGSPESDTKEQRTLSVNIRGRHWRLRKRRKAVPPLDGTDGCVNGAKPSLHWMAPAGQPVGPADYMATPTLTSRKERVKEKSNLLTRAPGTEEDRNGCCSYYWRQGILNLYTQSALIWRSYKPRNKH